eukprot:2131773-Pleurochrysis_carterae.AAC.1
MARGSERDGGGRGSEQLAVGQMLPTSSSIRLRKISAAKARLATYLAAEDTTSLARLPFRKTTNGISLTAASIRWRTSARVTKHSPQKTVFMYQPGEMGLFSDCKSQCGSVRVYGSAGACRPTIVTPPSALTWHFVCAFGTVGSEAKVIDLQIVAAVDGLSWTRAAQHTCELVN